MNLMINISDSTYEAIMARDWKNAGWLFSEELKAIHDGTPIPDNATNGDMIKALFPNAEFDNAMPFTDGRWETMNLDTENRTRAIYKPTQLRTYADWWNSPYKRGDTE